MDVLKFVEKWKTAGLITEDTANKLKDDVRAEKARQHRNTMNALYYTIGALLAGSGAITFICANDWLIELISNNNILQGILMLIVTLSVFFGGYYLTYEKQQFKSLGNALIFLSALLIGAAYILFGQNYNWDLNYSSVLVLWFISVFPLAFIFNNRLINGLSIILFLCAYPTCCASMWFDFQDGWLFILFTIFGIMYTFANIPVIEQNFNSFAITYKMTALIPLYYILLYMATGANFLAAPSDYSCLIPVFLILGVNIYFLLTKEKDSALLRQESIFTIVCTIFLLMLFVFNSITGFIIPVLAHAGLIFIIISTNYWGYKFENVSLVNLANFFLIIYILSVYCKYGWSYMDKTLFFIVGSIIFISLGVCLEKHKTQKLKFMPGGKEQ